MPTPTLRDLPGRLLLILAVLAVWLMRVHFVGGADLTDVARLIQDLPADLVVNAEGATYDSDPSLAAAPDGSAWMAWHAYHSGRDRVLARRLGLGEPGPIHVVHEGTIPIGPPVVVADGACSAQVFCAGRTCLGGLWHITGRRLAGEEWEPSVCVSSPSTDAVFPAAARLGDESLVVSWCACAGGRFQVWARPLRRGVWQELIAVSSPEYDSFRSSLAVEDDGRVWVFWDGYRDGHYAVWGRPLLPELGPAEQISPADENCLIPVALAARSGVYVAWLQVADVIGGEGAITQWHTLHVAVREGDGWRLVRDDEGNSAAATLTHGLIARMEPEPVATGGYLGRRRHPMLLEDEGAVWLLWERKTDHRGATPAVTGELIGRRFENGRWQQPVVLHQGYVDYHLATPPRACDGKFLFVASDLPRKGRRLYHCEVGDLSESAEFHQDDWPGWRPVALPLPDEHDERHEICVGDRVYHLYWGDLHCHSGLTADAEGEPDELLHYARDRAKLDVVVMTQNDHIYDSFLTEGEFALDRFFARAFTQEESFLVLPGFEWTSRLPKSPDVPRSDPANWTYPNWGQSYPNHRSVIYPPAGGPLVRHPEVANDIQRLNDAALEAGGLTLTQHGTWDLSGHPVEVGVEVCAGWGVYIENPARIHRALDEGYRFGFVGNGDSHRRNPGLCGGLTAIYAERLTADAVLDALRNRRVYATNGSRIILDSRANGVFMGGDVRAPDGSVEISLAATGTRPIVTATLVRDGEALKTFEAGGTRDLSLRHRDTQLAPGTHWYYWRIAQEGTSPRYPGNVKVARGHLAWSTPHWVIVE